MRESKVFLSICTSTHMKMAEVYNYDLLLKRVRESLPENIKHKERFVIPVMDVFYEGKNTIIRNFLDVAKKINREPMHVYKYLMRELGTAGNIQGERLILKGHISQGLIQRRFENYVRIYVICYECGSPDTELRKEGRVEVIVCKACGAIRPVHAKIDVRIATETLIEGKIYDLEISDISKEGNGIAKYGAYTIYVPGARKGEKVKVKIIRVKKNIAFGEKVS